MENVRNLNGNLIIKKVAKHRNCVDKCPAKAFLGVNWSRGMSREKIFIKEVCKKTQLERMKKATGIDVDLCRLCFAVCPYTQRYLNLKG